VTRALIAPSLLACNLARVAEEVADVEAAGADLIHFDVMDGNFVPNLSFGPRLCAAVQKLTSLPLDVHLMVVDPDLFLEPFARAGAHRIAVHVEILPHLHRTLSRIRELGVAPGVALNPTTPVGTLEEAWPHLDFVLVMSVNPGFGGQRFIPATLDKLERLASARQRFNPRATIAVDGGVEEDNAEALRQRGVDVLVAGTAVFGAPDRRRIISALRGEEGP
jgi:ribulose-phosphate 3-epimerase